MVNFDFLLTVHLNIFISLFNQLDAQDLFHKNFITCLYMFRAHVLETCRGTATYRYDDTRGCVMQF